MHLLPILRRRRRRACRGDVPVGGGCAPPRGLRSAIAFLLVSFAAIAASGSSVAAQGLGTISGVVMSKRLGTPVSDANISVQGQRVATTSDASGRFRLAGIEGTGDVRIVARRIGFAQESLTVAIGARDVVIAMTERAIELNQVVVTGTAGIAERRAIANAASTIDASDVTATQPVTSVQELLTGRAAGVSVISSSGQPGAGGRIRIRGASSLSLRNDPLIYVDGVRVDNTQASGPTTQAFGSAPISRWNDFDPDDIESIEVIKGPAAATLYGTEASNGVIQIVTKKGAAGRPVWNATYRMGRSWLPDWKTRFPDNYGTVPVEGSTTELDTITISTRELNDSLQSRFGQDIFDTGSLNDLQLSVSGGASALQYYVGIGREEVQGVERDARLHRTSARVNLQASPSAAWNIASSMGYTTGRTYIPYESGGGGATWATFFASPSFLYSGRNAGNPQIGFRSGPPDIYYAAYNNFQDADRFTGSLQIVNRPFSFFNHRLILGIDRLAENNEEQAPRNDVIGGTYASFAGVGQPTGGSILLSTRDAVNTSFDYLANAEYGIREGLRGVTSAGGQFYGRETRSRSASGSGFPAAGLTSIGSAAIRDIPTDEPLENNTLGGFVQQQIIWQDRLYVTGAVRTDDNSAFGTNFDAVTYPKLGVSYVISEDPAVPIPTVIDQLRLRAAYGASGLQPGAFDAIRTYRATGGFLTPLSAGNPDLGPERSTEVELGFDASALQDRLSAEVTYFNGKTKEAILSRQSPGSGGFPGLQLFNAGRVDRNGWEWMLRGTPLRLPRFELDLTVSGSVNDYEIKSLGNDTLVSVSSNIAHVTGYEPGAWWDRRIVSAGYDTVTNRATNPMCDNGAGGTVACASAPRVYLGSSVPRREGSLTVGLTFLRDFRVTGFFDYRGGYKKLDGNYRVRCGAFVLCRELYYPDEVEDKALLAAVQAGTSYTYHLIKDASFTRFRELSLTYTVPPRFAAMARASRASITLAGRNLALWTDFPGFEPEASFNSGTRGGSFGEWEQNVMPQTRHFVTTVNLSF